MPVTPLFPELSESIEPSPELSGHVGRAGEYLVASELIGLGYDVLFALEGAPYDLCVLVGSSFVRVQVKTVGGFQGKDRGRRAYKFRLTPKTRPHYLCEEVQVFAAVIWPKRQIEFCVNDGEVRSISIGLTRNFADRYTRLAWEACLAKLGIE